MSDDNLCQRTGLTEIGIAYDCDKFTTHNFGPVYERYLGHLAGRPFKLLEIGIGGEDRELGGASLRVWEKYFKQAQIVGIDVYDKSALDTARITTVVCDQGNPEQLLELIKNHGPFDVIIDDGSHVASDTLTSLDILFIALQPGGWYIIEDIQTSFWPTHKGTSTSVAMPIATTAISWLKFAIDVVNAADIPNRSHLAVEARSRFRIDSLHIHDNIAFVKKSGSEADRSPSLPAEHIANQLAMDKEVHLGIVNTVSRFEREMQFRQETFIRASAADGTELLEHIRRLETLVESKSDYISSIETYKSQVEHALLRQAAEFQKLNEAYERRLGQAQHLLADRECYITALEKQKSMVEFSLIDHSNAVKDYESIVATNSASATNIIANRDAHIAALEKYKSEIERALKEHSEAIKDYETILASQVEYSKKTISDRDSYILALEEHRGMLEKSLKEHAEAIRYYERLVNPLVS